MKREKQISGLCKLSDYVNQFLAEDLTAINPDFAEFSAILRKSEIENAWFTAENLRYALAQWAGLLNQQDLTKWLAPYPMAKHPKKVGLILAGNVPLVGLHDILAVILSGHHPLIKLSSKDRYLLPFLLQKWQVFSDGGLDYEFVEKLQNYDAVIATGSNNTARYLEYYFKDTLSVIRKNRTSIAVLKGDETPEELQLLAEDIFRYFGLGCRNVTRLFIPQDYPLDYLFENFLTFKDIINHHQYANNYEYNRAVYLLNQVRFWDNNFVMLKEDENLFSPLSVINFTRYSSLLEVQEFISEHEDQIQAIVAKPDLGIDSIAIGEAQNPGLDTYADQVNTMAFLDVL